MAAQRFGGKAVLVTGAASGIGRATALRFADEHADLILADRDAHGLAEIERACGARTRSLIYDAADGDASAAMARDAAQAFGRLDSVICNAGVYRRGHFADISPSDWSTLFDVNLTSIVRIIQAVLPDLRRSRGNVVGVASIAALDGLAYAAHYAAAKAGVIALMKSLAVEFSPAGVRFNAVAPGRVKTAIATGLPPVPEQNDALLVRPPRLAGFEGGGEPADLAATIAFLASDDARYVTGAVLVVDGAQSAG